MSEGEPKIVRLLRYLWAEADVEGLRIVGPEVKHVMKVRDLFESNDPLSEDIEAALGETDDE